MQRWQRSIWHQQRRALLTGSVVKHYIDLPPNYKDEQGLPFQQRDLDAQEVLSIFGPGMSTQSANTLLRIIHGRRVAGTLEDPAYHQHTASFTSSQIETALSYLRKTVPVDEVINAGLRAEDELRELERGVAPPEEIEEEQPAEEGAETAQKSEADDVYGVGVFDRIRARNRARQAEEEQRLEEERRKKEAEQPEVVAGELVTVDGLHPEARSPWVREWQYKATTGAEESPEMTKWDRLAPSTVLVLLVVAAAYVLSEVYKPPKHEDRLWPEIPPAAATVFAILAANIVIWSMWHFPPCWPLLNRYFLMAASTPRPISIFGAMFSHQQFKHMIYNLPLLWFFGTRLHDEVGRGNFVATYIACGSLGFLTTMWELVLRDRLVYTTLGASGCVMGILTAYFWMHKFDSFKILGLPPDPYEGIQGLGFIGLVLGFNLVAVVRRKRHMVDVASHIGGMAAGVGCGEILRRRLERRKVVLQEKQQSVKMSKQVIQKRIA